MEQTRQSPSLAPGHVLGLALEAAGRGDIRAAAEALMSSFVHDLEGTDWKTQFLLPIDVALRYRESGGDVRALEDCAVELYARQASRAIPGLDRKDSASSWWLFGVKNLALALLWESSGRDRGRFPEIVTRRLPDAVIDEPPFRNAMSAGLDPTKLFRALQGAG